MGASNCRGNNKKSEKLSVLKKEMDSDPDGTLEPTGMVFHETRCGSTLVDPPSPSFCSRRPP